MEKNGLVIGHAEPGLSTKQFRGTIAGLSDGRFFGNCGATELASGVSTQRTAPEERSAPNDELAKAVQKRTILISHVGVAERESDRLDHRVAP